MPTSDLSREQMIAIVESGESFIHDGQIISSHDRIPAIEDLAANPADRDVVRHALQAERDALDRRLEQLERDGLASETIAADEKTKAADAAFAEKKARAEADAAMEAAIEAENKSKGPPKKDDSK